MPKRLREQGKNARRRAILAAARAIVMDRTADFSMARLAEKAGVALATPYNLIGTKSDILLEIVRDDLAIVSKRVLALPTESVLQWITELARTLAHLFYPRRQYLRRMTRAIIGEETAAGQRAIQAMSHEIYEPALKRLIKDGKLNPAASAETLAGYVAHIMGGVQQEWMMVKGTEEGFQTAFEKGLLLLFAGVASPQERSAMIKRLQELEGG